MINPFRTALPSAVALTLLTAPALALDGVVASIKPVHSLVAAVMEGVGEPALLVKGGGSPHTYALRTSEAGALERASLVFWIGEDMEVFLRGPLETLAADATIVELAEARDLVRLDFREGGPFEAHDHGDGHEHDGGGHHEHDDDHGHAHQDGDGHGHDHAHGVDMHFWLDPMNARAFVHEIEEALVEADPENAEAYSTNAARLNERLNALMAETAKAVEPVKDRRFVVFHDAYQYFEKRFGIEASGSITVSPEALPGAARLAELKARIAELGVACVFAEPQFEPRLISVVTEGTDARSGVLDPLGADLTDGPDLYFELIRNLTTSLTECLAEAN